MPYITPDNDTPNYSLWRVLLPDDDKFLSAVLGQLTELAQDWNWEAVSGVPVGVAVLQSMIVYESFKRGTGMLGSLVHYVSVNPPENVLECDGSQYLRADYPDLYAALPASLIVDADNFIVPDLRDTFLLGAGVTFVPEDSGGETDHTLVVSELPAHSHLYDRATASLQLNEGGAPNPLNVGLPFVPTSTSNVGGDVAHNNMPPYVAYKIGLVAR